MKDPFYAALLFQIERMICLADEEAKELGIELTDSQVRSALIKARKLVQGANPEVSDENERDQVLARLIRSIYHAPDDLMEETKASDGSTETQPLQVPHWLNALETVADSIKTRKSDVPGSRCYLSYIHSFLEQAMDQNRGRTRA